MTTELAEQLVDALAALAGGQHPGQRSAHAKGVLCHATFHPTAEAASLSRAEHLSGPPVRAHVRFSNGSGDPARPDSARDARGVGVKFYVSGGTTDIVGLSLPVYFSRTPEDQLAFNRSRLPDPGQTEPNLERVGAFLAEHPETVPAIQAVMALPHPVHYGTVTYNGLHAFGYVGADGATRWGRWTLSPADGDAEITAEEAHQRPGDYLSEELARRLDAGPISYLLDVTLAADGDPVDDPTAIWPPEREVVRLGRLEITGIADDRERDGDILVMDPTRVTDGIVLSGDPILGIRRDAYSVSVARRTS